MEEQILSLGNIMLWNDMLCNDDNLTNEMAELFVAKISGQPFSNYNTEMSFMQFCLQKNPIFLKCRHRKEQDISDMRISMI